MRRRLILPCALAAVLLAGCGGSGKSSTVTPAAYVKSICSAIAPFERDVQTRSDALNFSSIKSASQGKTALHDFLTAIVADTGQVVSKLQAAGTPKVTNGKAIATGIAGAFAQLKTALARVAQKSTTLPTSSAQAFKTAAESLGTEVRTSMASIGSSLGGLRSPALEKAAAKEPSCKSLG